MSQTKTLLVEIGCEEIPARMLRAAARELAQIIEGMLDRAALPHGTAHALWTPRRLAVSVSETAVSTSGERLTVTGPPASAAWDRDGRPTRAAEGFARKHGVQPGQLERLSTDKGEYAAAEIVRSPRPVGEVLAESFERSVAQITFPKTMRWGDGRFSFVRPVHWLVGLIGSDVLPLMLFGVAANRITRGHRVIAPGAVEIPDADCYAEVLERAGVVVDPQRRRSRLRDALEERTRVGGGQLARDEALLDEVADMVEYPGACAGAFPDRFVDELPAEILSTCLRHHQRAFTVLGPHGPLAAFAVAVNGPHDPAGHIRRGNEWVVSGRLEDALFFWREDRRRPLADRLPELEGVVFHRDLETYAEKTKRVERMARWLASEFEAESDLERHVERAARLSRCDLVTGLVGEFPELQGIAGGLLASADGEAEEVVRAIYHFYRPSAADDELPPTVVGRLVGLADRLDTLAGMFAVGMAPSGSRDPFALRRAGTAAVRLAAADSSVNLLEALRQAVQPFEAGLGAVADMNSLVDDLRDFLFERLSVLAAAQGARHDELAAVRAVAVRELRPADLLMRLRALKGFRTSDDFVALASASKRVRNILDQAAGRGDIIDENRHHSGTELPAELALQQAVVRAGIRVGPLVDAADYAGALEVLASLRPEIDRFFDEVLVMDDDDQRRGARLGLLARFHNLAQRIVDISELVVDGRMSD